MNRQLDMPPLTEKEKQRLREINLYFLINHIFKIFGNRLSAFEMFDAISTRLQIHTSAVRGLLAECTNKPNSGSSIAPTIFEGVILMYKNGTPVSLICKRLGNVTPKTVYNYVQEYIRTPTEFQPKLSSSFDITIDILYPFLKELYAIEVIAYDAN